MFCWPEKATQTEALETFTELPRTLHMGVTIVFGRVTGTPIHYPGKMSETLILGTLFWRSSNFSLSFSDAREAFKRTVRNTNQRTIRSCQVHFKRRSRYWQTHYEYKTASAIIEFITVTCLHEIHPINPFAGNNVVVTVSDLLWFERGSRTSSSFCR